MGAEPGGSANHSLALRKIDRPMQLGAKIEQEKIRDLLSNGSKFGVVGVGATVIHCAMVILLVQGPAR